MSKHIKSEPTKRIEMAGKRFGMWTVLKYASKKQWLCQCDCGQKRKVSGTSIRNGSSASCGCTRMATMIARKTTHGMYLDPVYKVWTAMIQRCHNPKAHGFDNYGERGIKVCPRWRESFQAFLEDMGPRPSRKHTLDRFPNNDGNYEPKNCRWATHAEQARNKRSSVFVKVDGKRMVLKDACKHLGLSYIVISSRRCKGWSLRRALSTPIKRTVK